MPSLLPSIMGTFQLFWVSNQRKSILFIKVPKTNGEILKLVIIFHKRTHAITTVYTGKMKKNSANSAVFH